MKSTYWYVLGNIIQKIAPWLVMIILTHYLDTKEYGIYSMFMSWLAIFEIVITLKIYGNGYIVRLVIDENNRIEYTATMQSLGIVLTMIWLLIYLMFCNNFNGVTGITTKLSIIMICSLIGTISFELWSSRQRVYNNYKKILLAIVVYGLIGPIVGSLTVFIHLNDPIFYVVFTKTVIQLIIAIPFFISNYKNSAILWNFKYVIDALKYNMPLMPYYLSMILLNHADRLMIQKINGYEDAALYSVSYSAAMMIFVVSGALNLSLQTWLFKELKLKDSSKDKSRFITIGTIIVALCAFFEIVMAPEIIFILGGEKYIKAIWVIPPLAISVIVMFIYQQYVNILCYYKRTKYILFASVFAAIVNIMLNAAFIPTFGYVAGGYTSLASYLLVMILCFILAKQVSISNGVKMKKYFNTKLQMTTLLTTIFMIPLIIIVYRNAIIRYFIAISLLLIFITISKKYIFKFKKERR